MASDLHGFTEQETLNKVLNTSNDSLQVDIVDATGVTITTSTESVYVDDADWTDSTSSHTLVGGLYQSTPQTITDGDTGPLQVNANGNLIVDLSATDNAVLDAMVVDLAAMETLLTAANVDHAANEALLITIDEDTNAIKGHVDGIETLITSTNSKIDTFDAVLDNILTKNTEIDAVLDTIDADTSTLAAAVSTQMQVDVVAISAQSDGTYIGDIKFGEALAAGDNNIGNVDIVTLPASTNTIEVVGDAAEDAAVAGNPVLVGGRYDDPTDNNSDIRSLNDGDVGALALDPTGAAYVREHLGQTGSCFVSGTAAVTAAIGKFVAIQFLEDTVFNGTNGLVATDSGRWPDDTDAATDISSSNTAAVGSQTFPQGMTIFGRWDSFILASGAVIAYVGNV